MHKIGINFRVSAQFNALISAVLLLSIMIVWTSPLGMLIKACLILFVLFYSGLIFWQHGLLYSKKSILGLKNMQGDWFLISRQGVIAAELRHDSTVTLFACILRFQLPDGTIRPCIIFNDAMATEDYRRLVVQLRTNSAQKAERVRRSTYLPKSR